MPRIEGEPIHNGVELGEIISDPGSVIRNFKEVKSGRIAEEDYLRWINEQALKAKEEAKKRRENPPLIANDSTGVEPKFYIRDYEGFHVTTVTIDSPQGHNGLGSIDMVSFQFSTDGQLTGCDASMLSKFSVDDQNAELTMDLSGETADYRYYASQKFAGKLGLTNS